VCPLCRLGSEPLAGGGISWFTPLHQAAWHGAPADAVGELITLGASRTLTTADGRTARELAAAAGHDDPSRCSSPSCAIPPVQRSSPPSTNAWKRWSSNASGRT